MIIGTNNSMTYLKPKYWWGYFLLPFFRCQRKSWYKQYLAGVRCFDIKVKFDYLDNIITFANGPLLLRGDVFEIIQSIIEKSCNNNANTYIIFSYVGDFRNKYEKEKFVNICNSLKDRYKNVLLVKVNHRSITYNNLRITNYSNKYSNSSKLYEKIFPFLYRRKDEISTEHEDIALYDFI